MSLKNRPAVTQNVEIIITALEDEEVMWIDGPDELRLDRQAEYSLVTNLLINDPSKVEITI